ncbi:PIN domain-containing protein [Nostoc sp. FACHB-152]|uniref:PIN domain-containing protein n=1 Tax=Nostoc sp. FACHB-152 TaxID=2692837 RepID=UPI00168660F2|nr:PIN domain-containing protein [Nostoc sp. FACHB-152]MBD2448867.1 PIN domain-containing protein [Nostoc sp. FACHB-152]
MKGILFDTDVVLDVLLQRQPFFTASALAIDTVAQGKVEGYLAAHTITNLFYILRKHLGSEKSRETLNTLMSKLQVAAVTDAVIREALASSFTDFEDAVTHASARAAGIEAIVTRNIKDFRLATIPVMLPEVFLATLS